MKTVIYQDAHGKYHRSLIRPGDNPEWGISLDPPDVGKLDWDAIQEDLQKELTVRELSTFEDLSRDQQSLTGAILAAIKVRLINLYKESKRNE